MAPRQDNSATRLDDAARAGWLYYVAGNTQEEIAAKMGISRQSAQRLVSLSVSEGLIKVRLDHPIGHCLDLAERLRHRFALDHCEVVPSDPGSTSTTIGIAEAGAAEIERCLRSPDPQVIALGTGRTLKAAIEQLQPMECPHHKVVSLTGNIAPDGSAAFYNVIFNVADTVKARSFPMPLPVIASSSRERELLHAQPMIKSTLELAARANISFVGIGHLGPDAPLLLDGFLTEAEQKALQKAGAVGEICGWCFDAEGRLVDTPINDRVASAPIPSRESGRVIALAMGAGKTPAIRAALNRRLANGLITDERTAELLLA
ncbi:MAG: DNA-binding transcriptional regulator [Pelagibacterium sp. SCN 64-44]|nr:MAG: DNA-binding transcriptional regulator [Pelagibacterium sp. SCN 64-44]